MKVVAVTPRDYLVEMSTSELRDLTQGSELRGWGDADIKNIGRAFEINRAWRTIMSIHDKTSELPKIANKLRALADMLEPIECEIPIAKDEK